MNSDSPEMRTKKRIKGIICFTVLLCAVIMAGCLFLYQGLFPKAKPVKLPEEGQVISVKLSCNTLDPTIPMGQPDWENLFACIREAEPTRILAGNELPVSDLYYGIEIQTPDRLYLWYVYEDGDQVYVESPYEGIYEADEAVLALAVKYFQEG